MRLTFMHKLGVILTIILAAAVVQGWSYPPAAAVVELTDSAKDAAVSPPDTQEDQSDQTLSDSAPSIQTAVAVVAGLFIVITLLPLLFLDDQTDSAARRSD